MKTFKKILCLILAFIMCFGGAVNVFAQSRSIKYISDIKIAYGESGKQKLIEAGYVVDPNFNANKDGRGKVDKLGSMVYGDSSVWIGLKETDNPLEAITDIAVMNMNGGYSFSGWAEEYKAIQQQVDDLLYDFMAGIIELRTNYEQGSPYAIKAIETLNHFVDSGFTNKRVGDLIKNKETNSDDIKNIFLMGNYSFIKSIEQCVAMGCTEWKQKEDGSYDTFVTRLNSQGYHYDDVDPAYNHERELISKAIKNIKTDIDSADAMKDMYYSSYEFCKDEYTLDSSEIPANASEEEIDQLQFEKYLKDKCNEDQLTNFYFMEDIIVLFKNMTIKPATAAAEKETLYDIIKLDAEDLTENDLETIRLAFTPGQNGIVATVGLHTLALFETGVSSGSVEEAYEEILEGLDEYDTDEISVYYGVDLKAFTDPDNAALTDAAQRSMKNLETNSFGTDKNADPEETSDIVHLVCYLVLGVAASLAVGGGIVLAVTLYTKAANIALIASQKALGEAVSLTYSATSGVVLGSVLIVVAVIVAVLVVITLLKSKLSKPQEKQDISYTKIPAVIVDKKSVREKGLAEQSVYYTYTCAERIDANKTSTNTLDIYGDLNGYNNKDQWVCLYYTKNRDCGDPITSSVLTKFTSEPTKGYVAIHDFGTTAATNLNKHNSGTNSEIYAYIKTTSFVSTNGDGQTMSVFSDQTSMILMVASFILGAALSCIVTYKGTKKKYSKAQ